jgi:hypothetical protein
MASRPETDKSKPKRLGRSAVTGHFVLKPVGKRNHRLSRLTDQPAPSIRT